MKAAALQTPNSDTELRQRARAAGQALADLESERTALADAEREIADLRSRRLARLAELSVDEVRELDEAIARANTRAEIAAAKIVPLEAELGDCARPGATPCSSAI